MRPVAAFLAAALVAGCGSTVQVTATEGVAGTIDQLGSTAAVTGAPETSSSVLGTPSTPRTPTGSTSSVLPGKANGPLGAAGTDAPAGVAATQPTAARASGPLELGFMTTNVGNAQSAGLNVGQSYPDKAVYEALVKEYNLRGGIGGRKIVPVYGETDTASSNWNTQFEAACQKLTRDHQVKAVLGYVFVFLDSFEKCLANKAVPHLYGGYQPGDVQAQRDFPTIVSVAHPTVDVVDETALTGALATGRLTTKSKLGIITDGCSHGARAFQRGTEPFLKKNGITYESVFIECAGGSSDASSALAAVQSAQLQFATHGVDVVYISNAIALLFFMQYAESQRYRPQYLNPGAGGALEAQGGAVPREQLKNLHGYGWTPAIDVGPNNQPYGRTPKQQACLAMLKKQGLVPVQFNDFMFAYVTCDSFDLYARALALTGGSTDAAAVQPALLQVMSNVGTSLTYGGSLSVTQRQRGGPGQYRETGWDDSCTCITYRGPVRTVPGS